ncbi:MAG: hypothetical protein ACTSYH_03465 [Candidatus Heimdallarchaeaceae archaeon]
MAYRTVILAGDPIRGEGKANATITPGMLIERMSTGNLRAHASAGQNAQRMFAIEDDLQGNDISDNYSANNRVQYVVCRRGDRIAALIADGEDIAIGDLLESNGDGYLKEHSASSAGAVEYPECIVAIAREAIDLSDSSGADPSSQLIEIEII